MHHHDTHQEEVFSYTDPGNPDDNVRVLKHYNKEGDLYYRVEMRVVWEHDVGDSNRTPDDFFDDVFDAVGYSNGGLERKAREWLEGRRTEARVAGARVATPEWCPFCGLSLAWSRTDTDGTFTCDSCGQSGTVKAEGA